MLLVLGFELDRFVVGGSTQGKQRPERGRECRQMADIHFRFDWASRGQLQCEAK